MKQLTIYIKNFKNIFNEQKIDLVSDFNVFMGQNGAGKTAILDAINFFRNGEGDEPQKLKTTSNTLPILEDEQTLKHDSGSPIVVVLTEITFAEHEAVLDKINAILKNNALNEKFELEFSKDDKWYRINRRELGKTGIDLYSDYFASSGEEYINYFAFLRIKVWDFFVNEYKDFFPESTFNKEKPMNEATLNQLVEQITKDLETDPQKSDEVMGKALKKFKALAEIYKKLNSESSILIELIYLKNTEYEEEWKFQYSMDELIEALDTISGYSNFGDSRNRLLKFFSNNNDNDVMSSLKELKEFSSQRGTMDDASYNELEGNILRRIERTANKKLAEVFSRFSIYAIPQIEISNNQLVLSVSSTEETQIGQRQTKNNSSGYKSLFEVVLSIESLIYESENYKNYYNIILIDEPDKNLYPTVSIQLSNYISESVESLDNMFVLVTTHSPFFMLNEEASYWTVSKLVRENYRLLIKSNEKGKYYSGTAIIQKLKDEKIPLNPGYSRIVASKILQSGTFKDIVEIFQSKTIYTFMEKEEYHDFLVRHQEKLEKNGLNLKSLKDTVVSKEALEGTRVQWYDELDLDNKYSMEKIKKDLKSDYLILIKSKDMVM